MKTATVLFTNDVETTSIKYGGFSDAMGEAVFKYGLPRLLDCYEKYGIKTTCFVTGYLASIQPGVVPMISERGHEIGCHGFYHTREKRLDNMTEEAQYTEVTRAKELLEKQAGAEVRCFRSPALRTNEFTAKALVRAGFRVDSSISSQRFDFLMSTGAREKLKWLRSPREPYWVSLEGLHRRGESPLLEVPVSAAIIPYISTVLRISPAISKILREVLYREKHSRNGLLTTILHPNEVIEDDPTNIDTAMDVNSTLISGKIRKFLKQRNLGDAMILLLENEIEYYQSKNVKFSTVGAVYDRYRGTSS